MMSGDLSLLMSVLDYELRCAKRYRRFVTLVTVRAKKDSEVDRKGLSEIGRDCDLCVVSEGSAFVLMTETPPEAARQALARYLSRRSMQNEQLQFSIASFPEDGTTAEDLLQTGLCQLSELPR